MLTLQNVTKYYGSRKALDEVTLSLPRGEIVGLFGENGAGKTTLMKSILGFHSFRGEILLDGEPITPKTSRAFPSPPASIPSFPISPPPRTVTFIGSTSPPFPTSAFTV